MQASRSVIVLGNQTSTQIAVSEQQQLCNLLETCAVYETQLNLPAHLPRITLCCRCWAAAAAVKIQCKK